jgi:hypothetical protein
MASESAEAHGSAEVHALAALVGERILTNVSYNDRVADLAKGQVNSYIIGWERNGGRNQIVRNSPRNFKWFISDTTHFSISSTSSLKVAIGTRSLSHLMMARLSMCPVRILLP